MKIGSHQTEGGDEVNTPSLIKILFFFLIFINVIASIGFGVDIGGFMGLIGAVVYLVLSVVMTRVFCELLIVVFKINENLKALQK